MKINPFHDAIGYRAKPLEFVSTRTVQVDPPCVASSLQPLKAMCNTKESVSDGTFIREQRKNV